MLITLLQKEAEKFMKKSLWWKTLVHRIDIQMYVTYVVGAHWICLYETIQMCTNNICYWK